MKHILSISCLAGTLLFGSCTTSYYVPSPPNVPMLQEEGEVSASVGRTAYNLSFSTDVQAAYSPLQGLGLLLNTSFIEPTDSRHSELQYGMKGTLVEGAAGYYSSVGKLAFDAYLGYGKLIRGATTFDYLGGPPSSDYDVVFNYHRLFLQPSAGFKHDVIDIILSMRLSQLSYQNVFYDSLPSGANPPAGFFTIMENQNFTMLEPAMTFRVGYQHLKLQVQAGVCYNISAQQFAHDTFAFSVGLVYNFRPSFGGNLLPRFN